MLTAPCCCFNPFILLFYFCIKWPQWKVGLLFPSPFKALSSLLCAASFSFIFACGNWPEVSTDWRSTISYHSKWKWHQSQWAERTFPFLSTDLFQYKRVSRTLYFYWSLCYWSHQIGLILLTVCCQDCCDRPGHLTTSKSSETWIGPLSCSTIVILA